MDMDESNVGKEDSALMQAVFAVKRLRYDDDVPNKIEEGLYLGSMPAAYNRCVLKSFNVTHILTVAASSPPPFPNDFTYKVINVVDTEVEDITQYFKDCFDFINEAKSLGGAALVHCRMGLSRSVTIVVAYLMKKHGKRMCEAMKHVKEIRPQINPNPGFLLQLHNFELSLFNPL